MEQTIIILYARPWSLVDERTQQPRSGVSVQYIAGDTLAPVMDSTTNERGYTVCKESITNEMATKLNNVPGIYSAKFAMRAKQGKNVLSLADIDFMSDLY